MSASKATLDALPTDCLGHVLSHLGLRDAAAAVCASKRFSSAAELPVAWEPRLARVYDLRLQATGRGPVDWPALYRAAEKHAALGAVRFRALFTDGGMDEGEMRYWADNVFAANHWQSHCSALGANVHIIGLLLGGRVHADEVEAAHRAFMIERLRIPAQVMFDGGMAGAMPHARGTRLEAWGTSELEDTLQMLHQHMDMGNGLGRLLLAGVQPADVPSTLTRLREVCDRRGARHSWRAADMVTPPEQPHAILDRRLLARLRGGGPLPTRPANSVSSVERITVSRAGHFSCPVRTGLVLLGDWRHALGTGADGEIRCDDQAMLARMQAVAADAACRAFDGVVDRAGLAALEQRASAGQVPRPVAWGTTGAGEWLEFDREWRPPPGSSRVRPVAWFRFFSAAESVAATLRLGSGCKVVDLPFPHSYTDLPGPFPDKEPQQAAGPADASGSPAATAADSQPMAMSQPAEVAGADSPAPEAAASASSADEAAKATPMSQLPDAVDTEEVGQGLELVHTAHSAAQELLDTSVDADDGFHLEDFQDAHLGPLDELSGSESEADEEMEMEMFVNDAAAADAGPGDGGAAAAAAAVNADAALAFAAERAAARSTDGRSLLDIRLVRRHAGSLALVKLIDSENLMSAWHDEHEQPNIDASCVALRGRTICLPDTVRYVG